MDRFERTHGGLPGINPRITEVFVATAEQIEANRLAIQELRREYLRHVHTTSGMSMVPDLSKLRLLTPG